MKHLHFVQSLEPLQGGGLGRAAADLHQTFRALGTPSRLVATAARDAEPPEVPESRILYRKGPEKAFFAPGLVSLGREWTLEADAVHGHGFYVSTNWLLGGAARRAGKALVLHPHGMFEPWILNRSRRKKRIAHLLFENANFRAARLWRALTSKEADQIREQGISAPIIVAPNGVDPAPFDALPAPPSGERRVALFLGRLHPKKGIDLLLESWGKLPAKERDEWSLVIAGPDEDGYRATLEGMVKTLALEDSVTFIGLVTGEEKIRVLRGSHLFVLTSHSEGFPVAILEAMASRLPTVATKACNFPDLFVEDGGWECETSVASITEALRKAIGADDSERQQRGAAARRLLDSRYTWAASAKTLLDACEQHCR